MMDSPILTRKLLDQLAYDYLHSHGFTEAAECLKKESKILTVPRQAEETKNKEDSTTNIIKKNNTPPNLPKVSPKNSQNLPDPQISQTSCMQSSSQYDIGNNINDYYHHHYDTHETTPKQPPTITKNLSPAGPYLRQLSSSFKDPARQNIRDATLSGDLKSTQKLISKEHISFFEQNKTTNQILFETRLQELLEAIKSDDLSKVLILANNDLKQLINDDDARLEQVQRALSLMIQENKYNKDLLDSSRRLFLWSEINRASLAEKIATTEPGNTQSALDSIFQIGKWAERKLAACAENNPDFRRSYSENINCTIYSEKNEKNGYDEFGMFDFVKLITEDSSLRYRPRHDSQASTSTTTEKKFNSEKDCGMMI